MHRRLFLSSADSDKFIVTFILNPFDSPRPSSYFLSLSLSRVPARAEGFAPDFASGPGARASSPPALRWIVSLSSLSSLDRNRAHRHPTRKGAPTCNAEMGGEAGSHVYGIREVGNVGAGLCTKAMPKRNLSLFSAEEANTRATNR